MSPKTEEKNLLLRIQQTVVRVKLVWFICCVQSFIYGEYETPGLAAVVKFMSNTSAVCVIHKLTSVVDLLIPAVVGLLKHSSLLLDGTPSRTGCGTSCGCPRVTAEGDGGSGWLVCCWSARCPRRLDRMAPTGPAPTAHYCL